MKKEIKIYFMQNKRTKIILLAIVFLSFLGLAQSSEAKVINVVNTSGQPSCEQVDVQTAINSASDGDTVFVPAGSCTWSAINGDPVIIIKNKSLILQGAGINNTTILVNNTGNPINLSGSTGNIIRITGFTFAGETGDNGVIVINSATNDHWKYFRIDHCKFNTTQESIRIFKAYGIIDHCEWDKPNGGGIDIYMRGIGFANKLNSVSFSEPDPAGTDNAVYIEDCIFRRPDTTDYTGAVDANEGGNYVARFNKFYNCGLSNHETAYGGVRGARHFEIYNNEWSKAYVEPSLSNAINIRAGTGNIFNNKFLGDIEKCIVIHNYRSDDTTHTTQPNWGHCDGTNPCDGNIAMANGSGSHTGFDNITILTDNSKSWVVNQWIDYRAINIDDGSWCRITANDATTITCNAGLATGVENDWDNGDNYKITKGYPCMDQPGRNTDTDKTNGSAELCRRTNGGKHNGNNNSSILVVTTANWSVNAYVGYKLTNATNRSGCVITSNTSTTATCTGGLRGSITENDWDTNDYYRITAPNVNGPIQAINPIYNWGNDFLGGACTINVTPGGSCLEGICKSDHIQAGRDFYNMTTSNIGTVLPQTCTPYESYWKTNEGEWNNTNGNTQDGQLYRCTATNTWTLSYTPYTYPHPLTLSDDTTIPAAPTGVIIL